MNHFTKSIKEEENICAKREKRKEKEVKNIMMLHKSFSLSFFFQLGFNTDSINYVKRNVYSSRISDDNQVFIKLALS